MERNEMHVLKRAGILLISLLFLMSYLIGGALIPKNQAHGVVYIDDWLFSKVADGVLNVANAAFLDALGLAMDYTENEALLDIEQFIADGDNLILAGSVDHSSEKILEELDAISEQIDAADTSTKKMLNEMFAYDVKTNAEALHKNLNRSYHKFSTIQDQYESYVLASGDYAETVVAQSQGKADTSKVKAAKVKVKDARDDLETAFNKINFLDELSEIAESCCVFYPSYSSDPDKRGNPIAPISQNYLGQTWKLLKLNVPFDHQKYEGIMAAANDSIKTLQIALQVNRIYFDYYYAKYSDNPKKADKMRRISNDFNKMANGVTHCINDIGQQCTGYGNVSKSQEPYLDMKINLNELMRSYDVETVQALQYKETEKHNYKWKLHGSGVITPTDPFTTSAVDTKPDMAAYRVEVNGAPYLFFKGNYGKNLVDKNCDFYYVYGQDYCNFLRTKDGAYAMPRNYNQVTALTETDSYASAGGSLLNYLKNLGGLKDLPGKIDYIATQDGRGYLLPIEVPFLTDMAYWCKDSINANDKSKAQVKVDLIDIYKKNNSVLVMMAGDEKMKEKSSVSVRLSDNRGSLEVFDEQDEKISGPVEAGTLLKLKLRLKEGAKLRSLKWVSKDGKTKFDITTGDSLDLINADKDGSYTFTYPMPYQDCTFRADFTTAEEEGEGTEENPYMISSAADLQDYLVKAEKEGYNNAHYKLTADISYTKENIKSGGRFHEFTGTFDGNGHSIEGRDSALFEVIKETGIVKNLNLVSKESMIGGDSAFAGENNGLITGCSYRGAETGKAYCNSANGDFGIFARENRKTGVIRNCYNAASVRSDGNIGGIACNNQGTIINCYNTGSFAYYWNPDKKTSDAGIAVHNDGLVENCYNTWVSREPGDSPIVSINGGEGNIADAFYKDWGAGAAILGTRLNDSQMKGDYMMNILNKNVAKTEELCQWIIKEGTNSGYPILGTVPDRYALSTDIKGKGSLTITGDEDKEIHKAVSGQVVKVTAAPEHGRQVDNLKLYDEKGKTIKKLEVKADEKGIVKTSFAMPEQNVTVHVKFVKQETPAAGKNETRGKEETGQKDSAVQKKGSAPIYDKAALTDKDTGITVAGDAVDTRAVLKVEAYDETDPRHEQIEDAASDDVLASYDVSLALVDEQGKEIKADTAKFKGTLDVAFPIQESDREKDLKVLHGSEDGLKFEDGGLKDDGLYHVSVSHLSPFAVVEHQEDLKADLSAGETLDPGSGGSAWIWIVIACIAAAAITAAIILIVRKRRKEKETSQ